MDLLDWRSVIPLSLLLFAWLTKSAWEPYLKGYFKEKGKRLATHEDIENVLREVRLVTAETKAIEARISGGEWDRQWTKSQKREAYVQLLLAAEGFGEVLLALYDQAMGKTPPIPLRNNANRLAVDLRRAIVIARMCAVGTATALDDLREASFFLDGTKGSIDYNSYNEWDQVADKFFAARDAIVVQACNDLGFAGTSEP